MSSITINPPKTPVTTGTDGIAAATVPNVCKMPGPPAPFVPTPLPNIAKSGRSPRGFSKRVEFDRHKVAIRGATFTSIGDIASEGTGGGVVSSNVEGPARFVGPGSLDVKVEGKNVHLLSDPMLNNCGPGGSPPNAATLVGLIQQCGLVAVVGDETCALCQKTHGDAARLEETIDTQADAGTMQTAAKTAKMHQTMLGVVRCPDGQVYAANSGAASKRLQSQLPSAWHLPPVDRWQNFEELIPAERLTTFRRTWQRLADENVAWNARVADAYTEIGSGEPFYAPGSCAAQQAVVLALSHGARPVGLTERWHGSKNRPKVWVHFRTRRNGNIGNGWFGGSQAVPPCGTCQVMLTMLLCPDDRPPECNHKPVKNGACKCST